MNRKMAKSITPFQPPIHKKRIRHRIQFLVQLPLRKNTLDRLKKVATKTLAIHASRPAEVLFVFTTDQEIKQLHSTYLNDRKTTDVISFDLSDPFEPFDHYEIVINVQQARREAKKRNLSLSSELALYLVHGLLHQLGFDDTTKTKAHQMHHAENQILSDCGFPKTFYR